MVSYLNLGCGRRFHPDWTNVDFTSTSDRVIAHNLIQGIPFPDAAFDVVYHSHVLEHFSKAQAQAFLSECCRVLRPQGVLRVVVPDLEQIVRSYLMALEKASTDAVWQANYDWILIEMYDQVARNYSGGEMAAYLFQENIPNEAFILQRCGTEAKNLIALGRDRPQQSSAASIKRLLKSSLRLRRYPSYLRELIFKLLLGKEYSALQIGRFRQSGEVHQWMYDRHSLGMLLKQTGLTDIMQRSATESVIPNWTSWGLDTEPDGSVYKPDSLFMEAIKPSIE
ncbi:MAG: methyltransferase domain-containing protein [Cyanophyceae cyanobacterium]